MNVSRMANSSAESWISLYPANLTSEVEPQAAYLEHRRALRLPAAGQRA